MKKPIIVVLALVMVLCFSLPAMAGVTVYVDDQQVQFDQQPYVDQEAKRTLVPFRQIFESLGAEVWYDEATNSAMGQKDGLTIQLPIDQAKALVNGKEINLDVASKVVNGRTMVPLRFIGENLGCTVTPEGDLNNLIVRIANIGETKVHFIDVGQADAIYIEMPNNNDVLIDGGNRDDGSLVVSYLRNQGVDDIELLIATHPHEDHIGALPSVLDAFAVEKIIDSGYFTDSKISAEYLTKAQAEGAVYEADSRQTYNFGNVALQVLTGAETWHDVNDYSVVCRLDTGDIEFMFTGDAEAAVEAILTGELEAEILKVGHHGSDSSTSLEFLNKVSPDFAIISVGAGNTYGHPTAGTLQKLQNAGVKVYRTDVNGNIVVTTDGRIYDIQTQKDGVAPQPVQVVKPSPDPAPQEPATTTGPFVGSVESDKYHNPTCRYAEKINAENEIWFNDVVDAQAHGYVPCGLCNP